MAGYSGTPLAKKLGLRPPLTVVTLSAPADYPEWAGRLPDGVRLRSTAKGAVEAAHVFVVRKAEMARHLRALPLGFVDIKVCAVSDVWSGLKLVIRKSERPGS
jgi:hypothetical protein